MKNEATPKKNKDFFFGVAGRIRVMMISLPRSYKDVG